MSLLPCFLASYGADRPFLSGSVISQDRPNGSKVRGCLSCRKTRTVNTKRTFWPPEWLRGGPTRFSVHRVLRVSARKKRGHQRRRGRSSSPTSVPTSLRSCDDVMILRHDANPGRMKFSERTGQTDGAKMNLEMQKQKAGGACSRLMRRGVFSVNIALSGASKGGVP